MKALYAGAGLVLQNTHYYATILRLPFGGLVVADLVALSHRARCPAEAGYWSPQQRGPH